MAAIQAETERILLEKFRLSPEEVQFACGKLGRFCHVVEPLVKVKACDDRDDDNDLLRLVTFQGIRIVRVRAFLELLAPTVEK